jgi:hypothetical protein
MSERHPLPGYENGEGRRGFSPGEVGGCLSKTISVDMSHSDRLTSQKYRFRGFPDVRIIEFDQMWIEVVRRMEFEYRPSLFEREPTSYMENDSNDMP